MVHEREIDALLSPARAGSIVDGLMALPQMADGADGDGEWRRAVSSRFQTHLVRQMRELIDGPRNRDAA